MAAAGVGTSEADTTGRYKTQAQAIEAIQLLLDRGADVNAVATDGRTAVHGAALQGYDDVIKYLAAHGADLQAKDKKGFTPLDTALGRAGGFGFTGGEGVVREGTAAVLRQLMGVNATPASPAAPSRAQPLRSRRHTSGARATETQSLANARPGNHSAGACDFVTPAVPAISRRSASPPRRRGATKNNRNDRGRGLELA